MTVVEAYVGGNKIDYSDKSELPELPPMLSTLLIEGIAQNTTGSVYMPEVCLILINYPGKISSKPHTV